MDSSSLKQAHPDRRTGRGAAVDRSARLRAAVALSPALKATVSALELLDDSALWEAAQSTLPQVDAERMEELHRRQRLTNLPETEARELSRLEQEYERVILVRSHSASLLEQRGHDIRRLTSSGNLRRLAPGG